MDLKIVSPYSLVGSLELLTEEPTFDVKVQYPRVVNEDREWTVRKVDIRLA
jgi:hypothetical protein